MEKRKKRFWSMMLSLVMMVGLLWAVPGNAAVVADDTTGETGVWTFSGYTDDTASGLTKIGDDYYINDDSGNQCNIKSLNALITNGSPIYMSGGYTTFGNSNMTINANNGRIEVYSDKTLICGTAKGEIENNGNFTCSKFEGNLLNAGTVTCTSFNNGNLSNDGSFTCDSFTGKLSNGGSFTVNNYFESTYTEDATIGTVVAGGPTTKIKSSRGEFELKFGTKSVELSGPIEETQAWKLMNPDSAFEPSVTISGKTYTSGSSTYVKDSLTLEVPSGCNIGLDKDSCNSTTLTIDESTYKEIIKDSDKKLVVLNTTNYSYNYVNFNDNFSNIVFDSDAPEISATFVADGKTITKPNENDKIEAKELSVTLTAKDPILSTIKYSEGDSIPAPGSPCTVPLDFKADKDNTDDNPKDCWYQVFDGLENFDSLGFKLVYAKDDFSADLSMSDVYYYGTPLRPTISNPSDTWVGNDHYFEYSSDGGNTFSTTEPKTAGNYKARAVFTGSKSFNDFTTDAVSFEIKRYDIKDFEVTVASKTLEDGEEDDNSYELGYNEPDDWRKFGGDDSKIKVEYKKTDGDGSYSEEPPSKSGTYVVKVTLQETDKYNSVSAESEPFEISKAKLSQFTLNKVDDIEVGAAFKPNLSVDSAYDGNITYKYKLATETDYGDTEIEEGAVITDSGEYTAKAIAKGSDLYEAAESNEVSFKVTKKNITIEVSAADVIVGETVSPVIVSPTSFDPELDVDIQYVYKGKGEGETAYTSEIPVNPGDYTVKAIISGSKRYEDTSATTSFTISKMDDSTAKVEVPDTVVGTEYEPVLTTMSDGKSSAKFEYKLADADDSTYSETKPTEPGKYVIRVTVPATDKYAEQICTDEFTISEAETPDKEENKEEEQKEEEQEEKPEDNLLTAKASVEVPDVYVGVTYDPILTTDSDGKDKAVFEYKSADDKDGEYSFDKPVKAGKYIVRATVPETDKYHEVRCEATFTISKITAKDSSVKISDIYVGTKIAPILISDSDGKAKAVFEYKKADDKDSAYSKTEPTKAGKYSVRATIPETDKYLKVVCESTFIILKITPEASVKLSDQYAGTKEYKPVLSTDSDGKSKAYFEY